MSSKYTVLETAAIEKLCSLVRESHSVADAIDDVNVTTNSTYSSKHIEDKLEDKVSKEEGKGLFSGNYNDLENKPSIVTQEEFNEKIFNETEFIEQKTDIFFWDYMNSTSEPTIEYTECYLDRSIDVLYMDITITFDTAESLAARKLTILDSDCYWDISRIEDYTLTFYDVETR